MPASPGFSPQVVVLDPERWSFQENAKGNRRKKYCKPEGRFETGLEETNGWFWKESDRKYPHEFWSEILACQLGAEMGVAVPRTHLGLFEGCPGSLAENLLAPDEELIEAADIMAELDPGYERMGKGDRQTVELAKRAIDSFCGTAGEAALEAFHRMLVFDAWIGNQDRHHENWGFVQTADGKRRFSDIFDNGSSLLRELPSDAALQAKVGTSRQRDAYAVRANSEIRWTPGQKISQCDLFRNCVLEEPGFRSVAERMLSIDGAKIEAAIRRVAVFSRQSGVIPGFGPVREGILLGVLEQRRARLIERLS